MLQLLLSFHSSSAMARSLQSVLAYDQYAGAAVVHGCKAGSWRYSAVELVEVNCMLMVVAAMRSCAVAVQMSIVFSYSAEFSSILALIAWQSVKCQ